MLRRQAHGRFQANQFPEALWALIDRATCLGERCGCQKGLGHCWPWRGGRSKGYGYISYQGKQEASHRLAFRFTFGYFPDPEGCHHCDNTDCNRPWHIYAGTQQENIADAVRRHRMASGERNGSCTHPERLVRGQQRQEIARALWRRHELREQFSSGRRGERNSQSKLNAALVQQIRQLWAEGYRVSQIAHRLENVVTRGCISHVVHRRAWTHVPDESQERRR